jgi:hypothetical protein
MLKRFLISAMVLSLATVASAQNWVAPSIIGGVIGYEIGKNRQPQIIVQPPPSSPMVYQQQVVSTPVRSCYVDQYIYQSRIDNCWHSFGGDWQHRQACFYQAQQLATVCQVQR